MNRLCTWTVECTLYHYLKSLLLTSYSVKNIMGETKDKNYLSAQRLTCLIPTPSAGQQLHRYRTALLGRTLRLIGWEPLSWIGQQSQDQFLISIFAHSVIEVKTKQLF